MKNRILVALTVALLMLGTVACSSSGGGVSQQSMIESDVAGVMATVVFILDQFEPFPPAPAPQSTLGGCSQIAESDSICFDGGSIQDCGDGSFLFVGCSGSGTQGAILLTGNLQFTMGIEWPTGTRDLDLTTNGSTANYVITFNGTDMAGVDYSDDVAEATCTVDLNPPVVAACIVL